MRKCISQTRMTEEDRNGWPLFLSYPQYLLCMKKNQKKWQWNHSPLPVKLLERFSSPEALNIFLERRIDDTLLRYDSC